jgi:hypothetical protein
METAAITHEGTFRTDPLLAENTGTTEHSLRIVGQGIDVSTDIFGPWESRSLTIVLPPGKYQLTWPIPGHERKA